MDPPDYRRYRGLVSLHGPACRRAGSGPQKTPRDGLLSRSAIGKANGINEKQFSHYLTDHRIARQEQNRKIAAGIIRISKQLSTLSRIV